MIFCIFAISQILANALEFCFGNPRAGREVRGLLDMLNLAPATATYTIGAEAADVITVAVQLKDADGNDVAGKYVVDFYLSDAADGDGVVGTAASGGIAAGTDGAVLAQMVTGKMVRMQCEADGDIDIAITHSGAKTAYLVGILPNGKTVISSAITWAA